MNEKIGQAIARLDGPLKVTGKARYSAEFPFEKMAYAVLVGSKISAGKISAIDTSKAKSIPGVIAVVTHENCPKLGSPGSFMTGAASSESRLPLQDNVIRYAEQYVAMIVAESLEVAQHAANYIIISYERHNPVIEPSNQHAIRYEPGENLGSQVAKSRGNAEEAFQKAAVKLDNKYSTECQNHNPMETHSVITKWEGEKLTVYDSSQYPAGVRTALSQMFAIEEKDIRVVSQFVGGAFGGKGNMWQQVPLCAIAAKVSGRPCKIMLERKQMFTNVGRRSGTQQRLAIGASKDGILEAIIHEGESETSIEDEFVEQFTISTPMLYACPNVTVKQQLVRTNRIFPTFMRAPGEATGVWVLESAMDELAHKLGMDPVDLRMKNYATSDPESGLPFSSKSLDKCYKLGAERINWSKRNPEPGKQIENGMLVGIGMASATRGVKHFDGSVGVSLKADGKFVFRSSTPEQGTGSITIFSQIAADCLKVPIKQILTELGDTDFPRAPVAAGSATVTTIGNAFWQASKKLQDELSRLLVESKSSPFFGASQSDIKFREGFLTCISKPAVKLSYSDAVQALNKQSVDVRYDTHFRSSKKEYSSHGFGAHFAEVRVDPELGLLRVSRVVSTVTCGRVINEQTCKAQVKGAVIWGISMALMESTFADIRSGRIMNCNLAEYHIPVNADIDEIEVHIVEEEDKHIGPLGAKGVGELGITGVPAAIANAIFNATGKRIRKLPITVDKLMV